MKVLQLIEALRDYEDFDVEISFRDDVLDKATSCDWPTYRQFNVTGIADVGYSSKAVILDVEER